MKETQGVGAGVGAALGGETAGLVDEFLGEVEGGEVAVAEGPEPERHTAGAAPGLEERGGVVGEEAADQFTLRRPEAEFVRRAGVVDDRDQVVEIGADGGGRYFFFFHAAMNMPLALSSWGQRKMRDGSAAPAGEIGNTSGSSSGCAAAKASATAVVSERVSVQTE